MTDMRNKRHAYAYTSPPAEAVARVCWGHHYGIISGLVREAVENTIDDEWVLQSDSSVSVDHGELGIAEIETLNVKIGNLIT